MISVVSSHHPCGQKPRFNKAKGAEKYHQAVEETKL